MYIFSISFWNTEISNFELILRSALPYTDMNAHK